MCDTQSKQNSKPGPGLTVLIGTDYGMHCNNPTPDTPRMVTIRDPRGDRQTDGIQNLLRYADYTPFPDLFKRMEVSVSYSDHGEIRYLTHEQAVDIAAWVEKMGDRLFTKPYLAALADLTERVHAALADPDSIPTDELAALVQESSSFLGTALDGLMLAFFAEGAGLVFADSPLPKFFNNNERGFEKFIFDKAPLDKTFKLNGNERLSKFLDKYIKNLPKKPFD